MTNLELGDIIKLHAPTNDILNNKVFIISYIDDNQIELNSSEFNVMLDLIDNKLTDESISKITILYRNELKGFIKQNGLEIGTWIDIHFSGDLPTIVTG